MRTKVYYFVYFMFFVCVTNRHVKLLDFQGKGGGGALIWTDTNVLNSLKHLHL